MTQLNWSVFEDLPGANSTNFENLWRKIVWSHYNRYGRFRGSANQPGVEFHLKLNQPCELGEPERWYGWQCKWYDIKKGRTIGVNRKNQIEDALAKTKKYLPRLTDWVLCTRYPLTRGDQRWFDDLNTEMQLHLWSGAKLEDHLDGLGLIHRRTYFGDLVLTPNLLEEIHARSVGQIKQRWQPEIHQELDTEQNLRRYLGETTSWPDLPSLTERLDSGASELESNVLEIPPSLTGELKELIQTACNVTCSLKRITESLDRGNYETLQQELETLDILGRGWNTLLCRLRGVKHRSVLDATNLVADLYGARKVCRDIKHALGQQFVAVVAEAGCGKTQLSAQLTAGMEDRLAGILLYGKSLRAGQTLDDIASRITIEGNRVNNFEALMAAVDAAGERSKQKMPIVIDGLNEAEDPRDWKALLASLSIILDKYPYVLFVCTLRPAFAEQALPPEVSTLRMRGFEDYTDDAINRYFEHYRIDPSQVILPHKLLSHPLTLRIFCEVINSGRERTVAVESIPGSLTALFERYLEQSADRIQELAPRNARHQSSDIRNAIQKIGLALWESDARSMGEDKARQLINDSDRPWPDSIMHALQDNGILSRENNNASSSNYVSIIFDPLGGYIVADALLKKYNSYDVKSWLRNIVSPKLTGNASPKHPLADDVFSSLIGLLPRRRYGCHLWKLLQSPLRERALAETAWLEANYLDDTTVSELTKLINTLPNGYHRIFDRIWDSRAIPSHPLNSSFLDSVLRPMSISDRDLRWTEWVRDKAHGIIYDLQQIEERWCGARSEQEDTLLIAKWIMWTLTSTVRRLRDQATKTLYRYGCQDPHGLFEMTLDSLKVNDPYVSERMLAACYGAAMSLWADPKGDRLRVALPSMAEKIIGQMFVPEAPYSTRHVLSRDYAAGLVTLATQVKPGCISQDKLLYTSQFKHLPFPFPALNTISDSDVAEAEEAVHVDFGNYTIGRLIPDRYNYDFDNLNYQDVRRQIYWRILNLGYLSSRFRDIDRDVVNTPQLYGGPSPSVGRVDRYGKKYSWIAFFEMFGVHLDEGILPTRHGSTRPSDADIDPSFPVPPRTWQPPLSVPFDGAPTDPKMWSEDGPMPDYAHLLRPDIVDDCEGPWVLLDGYIQQVSATDERLTWTILRCCFVDPDQRSEFLSKFKSAEYAVPEPETDYYTYAGEIPWSKRFGGDLRDANGRAIPNCQEAVTEFKDEAWQPGISVEVPRYRFVWEGYHSQLNQVSDVSLPAPSLCKKLKLRNHQGEWDLFDQFGNTASMYRVSGNEQDITASQLTYLRFDLLENYLEERGLVPVWLLWGERSFRPRSLPSLMDETRNLSSGYRKSFTLKNICREE